jgi:hypothetical protein
MAPIPGAPWTGPSAASMLQTHTLAHEIIARHDDPCPVLDGSELALLQDYIGMSDENGSEALLQQHAKETEAGQNNSLVAFVIRREAGGEVLLDEGEKEALRTWFERGGAEERMREWREGRGE